MRSRCKLRSTELICRKSGRPRRRPVRLIVAACLSARVSMVGDGDGDDGDSSSIDETLNLLTPRSRAGERLAPRALARRRRAGLAEVLVVGVGEGRGVLAVP